MNAPVKITYRHMNASEVLDARINMLAQRLEVLCGDVVEWRVVMEAPVHHQHQGKLFVVHVVAVVPGEELVIDRDPPKPSHDDAQVALADAFRSMRRRLQEYVRVRRHDVKRHSLPTAP